MKRIDFAAKHELYKDSHAPADRLRFIFLFMLKESPYFDPEKAGEMLKQFAAEEPLGNYYLFIENMAAKKYKAAFDYFRLWDPYLLGFGAKYPKNDALAEWALLRCCFFSAFQDEMAYMRRKTLDPYARCALCPSRVPYRHCMHYKLTNDDLAILNILRLLNSQFECSICYEERPYARGCGINCFRMNGEVCLECSVKYRAGQLENFQKCGTCRNFWCKSCDRQILRCPFCRSARAV